MFKLISAMLVALLISPAISHAGEKEDELIAKITEAYGGDALLNISNYKVDDHFISPATGQSHTPDLTEIGEFSNVLVVDLKNNKSVSDNWSTGRQGNFQNATVSDGEKASTLDFQRKTYGAAANADPKVFAGGTMRTADAVLVYELNRVKEEAKLEADESLFNRPHHVLVMPFPSSPDLRLYVDAETFLISKMQRLNPQFGALDYVFSNYKQNNGITYASSMIFSIAGVPNIISAKHELSFNLDLPEDTFAIPEGFSEEGERIDTSEMMITKLADGVHHVGQGNAFSLFLDTTMGVVVAGAYGGLEGRYKHYQSETDNYKPFTYQIITHHHNDHVPGASDAVALGAKLITVKENIAEVQANTNPAPDDRDFLSISGRTTFGEGKSRVEVYEVSTSHAASFLVTYVPAAKAIFIADHLGTPFATGTPPAGMGTVTMLAALEDLDIDIKKIATAHNARIFTMKDMRDSVDEYQPTTCQAQRAVCVSQLGVAKTKYAVID